ncbi:hypothetical protein OLMES_0919 [Oleiphilus messinensis]|uniref:Uncharacterized protein n=2 Tax=Oleiphilus messinensis TaxID=141451 RepID=A0A1Y0I5D8_9GAMM|nr:hypothetical protein OLMES_0919 [Oleiphilus messinensis]
MPIGFASFVSFLVSRATVLASFLRASAVFCARSRSGQKSTNILIEKLDVVIFPTYPAGVVNKLYAMVGSAVCLPSIVMST